MSIDSIHASFQKLKTSVSIFKQDIYFCNNNILHHSKVKHMHIYSEITHCSCCKHHGRRPVDSLARQVGDVHKRVVEAGEDVRDPEDDFALHHLRAERHLLLLLRLAFARCHRLNKTRCHRLNKTRCHRLNKTRCHRLNKTRCHRLNKTQCHRLNKTQCHRRGAIV